jgi:biopolymer transport protein ExbD
VNVSLTIDEKSGPLHAFAALDILVLIMLLGFVASSLVHRSGVAVQLPQSETKFPAANEALVLTVKGTIKPVFYMGARPIGEADLVETLQRKRDEEGLRMVLLRADRRMPVTWQARLSELVLSEGLDCGWLAEPASPSLNP